MDEEKSKKGGKEMSRPEKVYSAAGKATEETVEARVTDRFDLEQAIMNAWHTADDIGLIADAVINDTLTTDEIVNVLLGLEKLHSMRSQKVFEIFEALVGTGDFDD